MKPQLILEFLCDTHAMYTIKCKLVNCGILQPFQAGFILSVSSNCPDHLRTTGPWHSATCTSLTSETVIYREACARLSVTITEGFPLRHFIIILVAAPRGIRRANQAPSVQTDAVEL